MVEKKNRRSIRLPDYDYSQGGAYFVTICVDARKNRLGEIVDGEMTANQFGEIVDEGWKLAEAKFPHIMIPVSCVMPNHVHAIIFIDDMGRGGVTPPKQTEGEETSPLRKPTLGEVIAVFKYETTRKINMHMNSPGKKFWQRNYYERVIRNEREFEATHDYIVANPVNWEKDEYRVL